MGANKIIMNTPNGENVLIDLTGDSVTPADLAKDVTAHDKTGEPIKGNLSVITHISLDDEPSTPSVSPNGRWLSLRTPATTSRFIADKGTTVSCGALLSDLGDASPEDVAKGKTFTSTSGLKVVGTAESGGARLYASLKPDPALTSVMFDIANLKPTPALTSVALVTANYISDVIMEGVTI